MLVPRKPVAGALAVQILCNARRELVVRFTDERPPKSGMRVGLDGSSGDVSRVIRRLDVLDAKRSYRIYLGHVFAGFCPTSRRFRPTTAACRFSGNRKCSNSFDRCTAFLSLLNCHGVRNQLSHDCSPSKSHSNVIGGGSQRLD